MLEPSVGTFKSPLAGVADAAWTRFIKALEVQPIKAVSESGGLGSYDLRPRRLVELGLARNLRTAHTEKGRQIYECDLVKGTRDRFLVNPIAQYEALARSMQRYAEALDKGEIEKPDGLSKAGALAILHVGGRGALKSWPELFDHTRARYEAAQGAF